MNEPSLPENLDLVVQHLESSYPSEGCGLLLRNEATGQWRVQLMGNAYDSNHARDPARYPRTSRTAYLFDPKEWLRVSEEAEASGERVACIFHSHADVGAYFSSEDREMAAPDGEPLLPGVSYLVVAVDQGRATAARLFWWDGKDFRERPVSKLF